MPLLELFRPERPKLISNTANSYTYKYRDLPFCITPLYRPIIIIIILIPLRLQVYRTFYN